MYNCTTSSPVRVPVLRTSTRTVACPSGLISAGAMAPKTIHVLLLAEFACAAGLIYMGMGRQPRLPIAESYAAAR